MAPGDRVVFVLVAGGRSSPQRRDVSGFTVIATDGAARAGVLRTAHGDIPTPAFMPVGTKASVKTLHPDEVRAVGAHVILANTYHLHFRPGADVIERLGGLHAFSGWDGPILTDSGGFQVFSLRDTILSLDEDGVTFRSVYDGARTRFTPEDAVEIQRALGSDIAMCLDVCLPAGSSRGDLERAVSLTTSWAARQADAPRAPGQLRFGIAQGGTDAELRRRSVEEITALPFDGYALGGLAVGESKEEMLDCVAWATPLLAPDKPRYFMGIGDPVGILEVDRARNGHVRLRASDPDGQDGLGARLAGAPQSAERPVRGRSSTAGRRVRLPGVRAVLPRLHSPPRHPERGPGATAPEPA